MCIAFCPLPYPAIAVIGQSSFVKQNPVWVSTDAQMRGGDAAFAGCTYGLIGQYTFVVSQGVVLASFIGEQDSGSLTLAIQQSTA
jgi:hypothetical protein